MRISKIVLFAALSITMVATAHAATKCVALNSSTTCTSSPAAGKLDWSANCTTGSTSVAISGIAGCSSQNGNSLGTKSDSITTSSTTEENKYCWCKMTSPAVSSWGFTRGAGSAAVCADYCANNCAYYVRSNATFRSALFSGLGD